MSTTIDQRVVEMRFDNKHFESNVQQSLSTIEKLKQKLNLTGASKGLENISLAAKNNNIGLIGSAAEKVGLKFNAMYTVADQTLRNITNSVERTAKNMISAFTIDPIKTGLQEYETQIGAVQTIMANTAHQGTTLNDVNSALDTLNSYADKTIYNFTEMTRNIGTFTAAGVDLQTSVDSIQGIANLAAVSGSTSQQASTAMYQLSQALAAGKVSLMDWNSVVNAGMGGKVFQDALIRTSELLGTGAEAAIKAHGSFRESLTQGEWLTTDVLTETLKQFAGAYSEADLMSQGFTEKQAKDIMSMAETAGDAATKVKTFTQLMDTLKEGVQSGWTQTWELLIGDFEEAKALWTGVSEVIGGFINNISEARNSLLGGALNSPWEKLVEGINEAGISTDVFEKKVREVAKSHNIDMEAIDKKYESFEEACRSGAISSDILSEAMDKLGTSTADLTKVTKELSMGDTGEDVKQVQEALKGLGYDFSKFGVDGIIGSETEAAIKAFQEAKGLKVTGIVDDETLAALKEATSTTNDLIGNCKKLVNGLDELGGRELLIEGLKNAFNAFKAIIKPISQAFRDIFPPASSEKLYSMIEGFTKFTEKLMPAEKTVTNIRKTFKGFFALIDIGLTIVKAFAKGIGRVFGGGALGGFVGGILKITAGLGDFIVKVRNALKAGDMFENIVDVIASAIRKAVDIASIPADIIAGFVGGLLSGGGTIVGAAVELFGKFLQTVKDFLGIHSPSTKFFEIAENCILGLINGIKSGISLAVTAVTELGTAILKGIKDILVNLIKGAGDVGSSIADTIRESLGFVDWGVVFAGIFGSGMFVVLKKFIDILGAFASPVEALGNIGEGLSDTLGGVGKVLNKSAGAIKKVIKNFGKVVGSFSKVLKAKAFDMRASGILKIAAAIAILAGALALLTLVDQSKLLKASLSLSILVVAMAALAFAVSKMSGSMSLIDSAQVSLMGNMLVKIGIAILLLGVTLKMIAGLDDMAALRGLAAVSVFMIFMTVLAEIGKTADKNTSKLGSMMIKLSIALLILMGVFKLIAKLKPEEVDAGITAMSIFVGFIFILSTVTQLAGEHVSKFGSMMLKLSISMLILVGVIKLLGTMDEPTLNKGFTCVILLSGIIALLVFIGKSADKDMPKITGMLLGMSAAMLILTGVVKILGSMDVDSMKKGFTGLILLSGIIALLVFVGKSAGKDLPKVAGTLLAMSVAIGILGGIAVLLGLIKIPALAKGIVAVGVLALLMRLMITATKDANDVKESIIAMAAAIGVMVAAVAILTLIKPEKLAVSVTALSVLMGMFALMTKSLKGAQNVWKSLIVMTAAIALMAGIIYLLSGLPIEQTLGVSASLSMLLLSMSLSMKLMSKAGGHATAALPAMGIMLAVVAGLALILGILSKLEVGNSLEISLSLSILLLAMSAVTLILSKVGATAASAIPAAASVMAVIAIIGGIALAIGALMSLIPSETISEWKTGLQDFMDFIIILAGGLGEAIGAFVGGVIGGSLESFSTQLNALGDAVLNFSNKISGLNTDTVSSIATLAEMLVLITGGSILDSIGSFITGTSSIDTFTTQLLAFGDAVIAFSDKISGKIDETALTSAANAGLMFAELNNSLPKTGGVLQTFVGENDFTSFSEGVSAFCTAIIDANEKISADGFTLNDTVLSSIAAIGTNFAELQTHIPKTGGVLDTFAGTSDFTSFSEGIKAFVAAMVEANKEVSVEGFTVNETALAALTTAGTNFATLQAKIPKSGGLLKGFVGEGDLDEFSAGVKAFVTAMVDVNSAVSTEGFTVNETALTALATAGTKIAELESVLPKSGGWWQNIAGSSDISDFGARIKTFGESMVDFASSISSFDDSKVQTVITTANRLKNFISGISSLNFNGIMSFEGGWGDGNGITGIANALNSFSGQVANTDLTKVGTSINVATRIKNFISSLAGLDTSGVDTFKSAISSLGETNVSGLTETFNSASSQLADVGSNMMSSLTQGMKNKSDSLNSSASSMVNSMSKAIGSNTDGFNSAGVSLMSSLLSGILVKVPLIKAAVTSTVSSAASSIRTYYSSFSTNGQWLGSGLIAGINAKKQDVYNAAYALGQKAVQGEKDGQKSKSPSKATEQAGKWFGEGLVIGIDKMGHAVYNSAKGMGQTAVTAMSSTVSKIASAINTDIDSQPTIRPVLDLSDVQSGASTIGNLFNSQHSVGLAANLSAITTSMASRNQNGGNDDVVSAINKLSNKLSNIGNTNYNVNGVTYDDGSNVSNAVQSLIRAAKIEGRA